MSLPLNLRKTAQRPLLAGVLVLLAVGAWGALLLSRSSPVERHIAAGVEYARLRQGPKAEQEWLEATRQDASDPRAWDYLSEYYLATHNWPAATEALQKLAQLKPETPHLQARLAQSSLQAGDERAAYGYAEESLKREPNDAETLQLFCTLLQRTGEDQRRLELLRRLVTLQPENAANQMALAEALVSKQLFAEARPRVEQILQRDPANVEACSLRGMITFNADPSPQGMRSAEADFLRVVRAPRFAPFAHFYLGKIYLRLGQPAKAVPPLKAAAKALPNKREVLFALSDAYGQAGKTAQAEQARQQFEALRQLENRIDRLTSQCAANPNDVAGELELANLLLQHGEFQKAEGHLNKALALHPNDPRVKAALQQLAARMPAAPPDSAVGLSPLPSGSTGQ
jgi:predicted Zn-dependent protease